MTTTSTIFVTMEPCGNELSTFLMERILMLERNPSCKVVASQHGSRIRRRSFFILFLRYLDVWLFLCDIGFGRKVK